MKIETPIIGLLLASVLFSGLFTVFFSLADDNDVTYDLSPFESQDSNIEFQEAFGKINETKNEMDEIIGEFEETTISDSGSVFPFLSLALKTGKQFFNSLTILKDSLQVASELLGLPPAIIGAGISILLTIMVISIIMILLGRSY